MVIPKEHKAKFHELSDESLADILPVAKKIALALGIKDYNVLQNNGRNSVPTRSLTVGRIANQVVDHVHFHVIFPFHQEFMIRLFRNLIVNKGLELDGLRRNQTRRS